LIGGRERGELADARAKTDALFALLRPSAFFARPIPERHRFIFYRGHLEAFDRNLITGAPGDEIDRLFAFGIDPIDGKLPDDVPSDWPVRDVVEDYVARTRSWIDENPLDPHRAYMMIEHRLMHLETLAYMFQQLPHHSKIARAGVLPSIKATRVHRSSIAVPAGRVTLGKHRDDPQYGWDNEYASHDVEVPAFVIDNRPVTNADLLELVRCGGYQDRSLWSPADWSWKESFGLRHPFIWTGGPDRWFFRDFFEDRPLDPDEPAWVSHAEASAFARWRDARLMTEPEWHRAIAHGGVVELEDNGWEWTSTPFAPFPGFEIDPLYPGYSRDFFDGKHFVMLGAAPITPARLRRRTFRNWFQPHYPYVHAKFRCVAR
jgi:gamma-glutamyl hercynylcysteine S-oxide synthase